MDFQAFNENSKLASVFGTTFWLRELGRGCDWAFACRADVHSLVFHKRVVLASSNSRDNATEDQRAIFTPGQ